MTPSPSAGGPGKAEEPKPILKSSDIEERQRRPSQKRVSFSAASFAPSDDSPGDFP